MTTSRDAGQGGGTEPSAQESRYGSRPRGGPGKGSGTGGTPGGGYPAPPVQGKPKPGEYGEKEPSPEQPTYPPPDPYPPKGDGADGQPPPGGEEPETFGPDVPEGGTEPVTQEGTGSKPAHPCPPSMTCNTGAIDDLQCEAQGVKAESDALAAVATALTTRRTAFETARGEYSKARDEAVKAVKELNRRIKNLQADIKCLLNRDQVDCLDKAFQQVLDCLEGCPEDHGCCVSGDCGFEDQTWTVQQIDDLRGRVEKAEKCFDEVLVTEPAALKKRVADVQSLVEKIADDMKVQPRDGSRLYARILEARRGLDTIWGSFKDVNEFQNCLCCGLTCSLKGRQLLAQLAGDKAYLDCQEVSRRKRCDWLRKNLVEETLATVLVICPPSGPCKDESTDDDNCNQYGEPTSAPA